MSRKKEKHKKNKTLSAKPSLTVVPSRDGVDLRATQHSPVAPKGSNATSYAGVGRTGMQAATNLRPIAEVADKPEPSGFPKLIQALELFRDQQNQPCAVLKNDPKLDVFYIGTKPFKQLLEGLFYDEYGKLPKKGILSDGVRLCELLSSREMTKRTVWKRFAHFNGEICIDTCDGRGSVIVVTGDGYSIRQACETGVYFSRNENSCPLPTPIPGGDYLPMFDAMNLKHKHDLILVATWPIVAAIQGIPKPPLMLYGPAGSTKSTMALMLKNLIAPDAQEGLKIKNNDAEMAQIIDKHDMPFFDNVTSVPQTIADLFCMAVTGGNFIKRKLFTDSDEVVFNLQKPMITTSLDIWTNAADLLDRCLFVEIAPVCKASRRDRTSILTEYNDKQGLYLDGFLNVLAKTLQYYKGIHLEHLPRMADYYKWAYAASLALGFDENDFVEAYRQSRLKGQLHSLDQDGFGRIFVKFLDFIGPQEMPSTLFHTKFLEFSKKESVSMDHLPKAANAFSKKIRHMSFALQPFGWSVAVRKGRDANMVCVNKIYV